MNHKEIVDALIDKIKKDYKDDVAFVVIHGSTIYNETHAKSDLDLYYCAKTERGNELAKVFILDGVGYDIWSIPWDRLLRIASHDERITSIITEGRVVYYGNDDDLRKFNELRANALDVNDRLKFINKAQSVLDKAYKDYYFLSSSNDLYHARMYAIKIIYGITHAIALLNRDTIKRGRGKLKKEILAMPLVPRDFGPLYETVFSDSAISDMKRNYSVLLGNTQALIDDESRTHSRHRSFHEGMDKLYEEMINFYNKIRHACEIGDSVTALFAAVELQSEFENAFAGTGVDARTLPNIIEAFDPNDTKEFLSVVDDHQKAILDLIGEKGIEITEFGNLDEVKLSFSEIGATRPPRGSATAPGAPPEMTGP